MYLIGIYHPDGGTLPPERMATVMRDVVAIQRELKATDSWVFGGGLFPSSTATVVRVKDGETLMTDGPFIEGKEHVGGFSIIRAPDLDVALEWGKRYAQALGVPIEVRPFRDEH